MSSRPIGAGAGEPSSAAAASSAPAFTPAKKKYRPPTNQEVKEMIEMLKLEDDETTLTIEDADNILNWLKEEEHLDLAVDWFYEKKKDGKIKLTNPRYKFNSARNSILATIFLAEDIPVDHPIFEELACRSPDFTIQDEDEESLLQIMEDILEYWDDDLTPQMKARYDNFRAKYELAKNPKTLKQRCNRKYMRQGVKNVRSLLLASKSGLPIPEGPMSVVTGMLTGKRGSTAQQMTAAKQELFPNLYGSSSSSSSSSSSKGKGRRTRKGGSRGTKGGHKARSQTIRK